MAGSKIEQPPGLCDHHVCLDYDRAVEAMVREDGFQVFGEVISAQHGIARRHPGVVEQRDVPVVLMCVDTH